MCQNYFSQTDCKFGEKCSFLHKDTDHQPNKRTKKGGRKASVALMKIDFTEEHEILEIQTACSLYAQALHSLKIQKRKIPSLGAMQPTYSHERSFFAPKFEDRTTEVP